MNLKATIAAGVLGLTVVTAPLVFEKELAKNVWDNILELKNKIEDYALNENSLVEKYTKLKTEAEEKIAQLKKELEDNKNTSESDKKELKDEIDKLTEQLNIANKAIGDLKSESDKIVAYVEENYTPTNPESLPGLDVEEDDKEEVEEKWVKVYSHAGNTRVSITPKKDLKIGLFNAGDIIVKFIDNNNNFLIKSKLYSGYLNDSQGNKYGNSSEPAGTYENQLLAGNTYYTTLNEKTLESEIFPSKIDVNNIVKVEVTINYGKGNIDSETVDL